MTGQKQEKKMNFKSKMVPGNKANPADILKFAGEKGKELSEEELNLATGGCEWQGYGCPFCGSVNIRFDATTKESLCRACKQTW